MIEEKIAKFRELIARRDEIDAELLALVGGTATDEPTSPPRKQKYKKRAPKEARSWTPKQEGAKRKRGEPCSECGSKGWRHFATCSRNGAYTRKVVGDRADTGSHGKSILDNPEKITIADWVEMKEQFDDGVGTEMLRLSFPQYEPMEIKRAVKFDTFREYEHSSE
jgi:hypothetical protein